MSLLDSLSGLLTGGESKNQQNAAKAGINALTSIKGPSATDLQIQLQNEVNQGTLTPEQAQAIQQNPSAYAGILQNINPAYNQASLNALNQLQQVGEAGGMTPQMLNQEQQLQDRNNSNLKGQEGAILQNAQQRGLGGAGTTLAAQLSAAQNSATNSNQAGLGIAAQAQQNALTALQGAGQLGQNLQGQAFGEQGTVANAQNQINQFNAQNAQNASNYNTQAANAAQAANLANRQNIANTNTNTANQEALWNSQVPETVYNNQLGQGKAVAGQENNAFGQYGTLGKQNANVGDALSNNLGSAFNSAGGFSGIGNSINSGVNSLTGYDMLAGFNGLPWSDKNLKEEIKPFDASDFLNSITGHTYSYKPEAKMPEGRHAGVMAQDLEKTPEGAKLVTDTPHGKKVDYSKSGGLMFASLANLHDRMKKLEGEPE